MPRPGYDDVVLVTGFPSLYARKMVEHILTTEPRALVYVVVLAKFEEQAQMELETLPASARERVVMLEGDAAAMDLGLSGAEFRQLGREVDRIHHMAHASYIGVDEATAKALNVAGAAEILELARAATALRCLTFHSTALVSGDRTGVVYEDDLDAGQAFRSVVDETRMRGEVLVRRAMREVPIAVVRPTTLVGDSGTGEVDRFDGPYLLILLIVATPAEIAIPLPGKGDQPLNIVPIDYVVRAAHALGRHPLAPGRTFHLADPHPLSARRVFELCARAGGRRPSRSYIPSNLAKALLRTPGIERFVRSPRAFVEQLTSAVRYDARNTEQLLAGTGITCPPFESYVDQLVAVVEERVRSRRERREAQLEAEVEIRSPSSRHTGSLLALAVTGLSAIVAVTCSSAREPPRPPPAPPIPPEPILAHTETAPAAAPSTDVESQVAASAAAEPRGAGAYSGPLARFFGALAALERKERHEHVRVVWLGDSHGAADFWTGTLRAGLQKRFGKAGPGFVYLGYKGYRHEGVTTEVEGKWAMRPKAPATSKPTADGIFGLGGILLRGFEDQPRATLVVTDTDLGGSLSWDLCTRFDAPNDELAVVLDGGPRTVLKPQTGEPLGALRHTLLKSPGPATVTLIPTSGQPELCGMIIETDPKDHPGVVLDTLGINGARFGTVLAWNESSWAAELARRSPDLVVLEFGTNEATDMDAKPEIFARQMTSLLGRIRKVKSDVDCAVLSPTDRADREEVMGPLRDALQGAAASAGCWFFDTYQAMGGRGAISKWRDETPPRAAKDGIHLTPKGYRELGLQLLGAMMKDFDRDGAHTKAP